MADYQVVVKLVDQTRAASRSIETGLQGIQTRADAANKALANLGSGLARAGAVAGAALSLAAAGAIRYADSIQDASEASGVGVATILALGQAITVSGGKADDAQAAVIKFADAVGSAAAGSEEGRKAFARVGVSLTDLAKLSEEDLLKKTLEGLGKIPDLATRASVQTDIFGKTLKGVNVSAFSGDIAKLTAEQQKNAASIKSAADTVDVLKAAYGRLQISILNAIKPAADFINKLSPEQIDRLVDAVLKLGVAIVGLTAGIKVLQAFGLVITSIGVAWALFTAGSAIAAASVATQVFRFAAFTAVAKKAFSVLTGGAAVTMTVGGALTTVATKAQAFFFIIQRIAQTIGLLATRFLPVFIGGILRLAAGFTGIVGIAYGVASAIDAVFDTKIVDTFIQGVKDAYEYMKKLVGLGADAQAISSGVTAEDANAARKKFAEKDPRLALPDADKRATPDTTLETFYKSIAKAREEYALFKSLINSPDLVVASAAFEKLSSAADTLGIAVQKPAALIEREFNQSVAKSSEALRIEAQVIRSVAGQTQLFSNEIKSAAFQTELLAMRLKNSALMAEKFYVELLSNANVIRETEMRLADVSHQTGLYAQELETSGLAIKDQTQRLASATLQQGLYADELANGALALLNQTQRLADVKLQQGLYADELGRSALNIKDQTQRLADAKLQQGLYANEIENSRVALLDQTKRLADATLQQGLYRDELGRGALALADQAKRLRDAALQQELYAQESQRSNLNIIDQEKRLNNSGLQWEIYANDVRSATLALQDQSQRIGDLRLQSDLMLISVAKTRLDLEQQQTTLTLLNGAYAAGTISLNEYADALGGLNARLLGANQLMAQAQSSAAQEVKLTADRKTAVENLTAAYADNGGTGTKAFLAAARALGATKIQITTVTSAYQSYADRIVEYNDMIKLSIGDAADTFTDEFSRAFVKGENMLDSFKNFFGNIMNDIATNIIKKQLADPIAAAMNNIITGFMGSSGSSTGGFLSELFSGLSSGGVEQLSGPTGGGFFDSLLKAIGIGEFANGGLIGAGNVGLVGEQGPEFITGPANITPMDKMSGSTAPNVNITINAIDTQTGVQFLLQNKPAIVSMVTDAYNRRGRGGPLD